MRRAPSSTPTGLKSLVATLLIGVVILSAAGPAVAAGDIDTGTERTGGHQEASAVSRTQENTQICNRSAAPLVTIYNENLAAVPEFLRGSARDTEIHGVIRNDTRGNYTFVTNDSGTITSYRPGTPDSANLRIFTDCETLATITEADDPVSAFWTEYENDEISIVGVGPFNWAIVEGLKHFPLLVLLVVLALGYVAYRRYSILSRGFSRESGLRRTDAGDGAPQEGRGESGGSDGGGSGGAGSGTGGEGGE